MYQQILGPDQENTDITHITISVLPKSNFMGTAIFFNTYAQLLTEPSACIDLSYKSSHINLFEKAVFRLGHIECPRFQEDIDSHNLEKWKALSYTPEIPWDMIRRKIPESIAFAPEHRFVFIFRNPLDQILSLYKHINEHLPDDVANNGENPQFDMQDFADFIFNRHALSSYIKMFYTFHAASQKHPNHILFVPYEELIHDKPAVMLRIMRFLEIPYDATAFDKTIELTSLENIKAWEDKLQHPLFGTFNQPTPIRHIRNGGKGIWQSRMSPEMIHKIEDRLHEFGLSLHMFDLADELDPQFSFLKSQPKSRIPKLKMGASRIKTRI